MHETIQLSILLVAPQDAVGSLFWGPVLGNSVQYMELVNYHTATWKHQPWITAVVLTVLLLVGRPSLAARSGGTVGRSLRGILVFQDFISSDRPAICCFLPLHACHCLVLPMLCTKVWLIIFSINVAVLSIAFFLMPEPMDMSQLKKLEALLVLHGQNETHFLGFGRWPTRCSFSTSTRPHCRPAASCQPSGKMIKMRKTSPQGQFKRWSMRLFPTET